MDETTKIINYYVKRTSTARHGEQLDVIISSTLPYQWDHSEINNDESRVLLLPVRIPEIVLAGARMLSADCDVPQQQLLEELCAHIFNWGLTKLALMGVEEEIKDDPIVETILDAVRARTQN